MNTYHYPAKVMLQARALHADGMNANEICDEILRQTGRRPNWNTVKRWIDPDAAERRREAQRLEKFAWRLARGGQGRLGAAHHTPAFQDARARALVLATDLSSELIATLMDFDYPGHGWNVDRVDRATVGATRQAVAA